MRLTLFIFALPLTEITEYWECSSIVPYASLNLTIQLTDREACIRFCVRASLSHYVYWLVGVAGQRIRYDSLFFCYRTTDNVPLKSFAGKSFPVVFARGMSENLAVCPPHARLREFTLVFGHESQLPNENGLVECFVEVMIVRLNWRSARITRSTSNGNGFIKGLLYVKYKVDVIKAACVSAATNATERHRIIYRELWRLFYYYALACEMKGSARCYVRYTLRHYGRI